jgi:1-deoxy-D-xylulose-5-phosphate synthase
MGIGEHYVTHGDIENLLKQEKLSMDDVELRIQELNNEKRES